MAKAFSHKPKPGLKKVGKSSGSNLLSRIVAVSSNLEAGIKCSFYGKSGTGKTTFAASFPKPAIILGAEDGQQSVYNVKDLKFLPIERYSDIAEFVAYQKEENAFKTVILDTATALADIVLKEVLNLEEAPTQLSWGVASQQQWGQVALLLKEALGSLIKLKGTNVVILSQEREFNADESSEVLSPHVSSALSPSVVGYLQPAVDYVAQTFLKEVETVREVKLKSGKTLKKTDTKIEYCLRIAPSPVYATKVRIPKGGKVPEFITDPTYEKFAALIEGNQK